MQDMYRYIVIIIITVMAIIGIDSIIEMNTISDIREKVEKLENVTNYYQEQYIGLTDIDNIDDSKKIIYKRFNNTIVCDFDNSLNVVYGGKSYIFNKDLKFYYESDEVDLESYNLTSNILPGEISLDNSLWALAFNFDIKTEDFKGEECYVITYKKDGDEYINYIRKDDGVCVATYKDVDGEEVYNYYKTKTNHQKVEEFTYETIFNGYDMLITLEDGTSYVERANGDKEYIEFEE